MNDTPASRWIGFATLVVALLVAVAACAAQTPGTEEPTASEVVAVHEDVDYYGACGNEVLQLDGERFYPLLEDEEIDTTRYGSGMGVHVSTVSLPGPGDDVGTLTVYGDGYAHFVSDSKTFDIWLTSESRTYNWVC